MGDNVWFTPRLSVERWVARLQANDPSFTALYGRSNARAVDDALLVALAAAVAQNHTVQTLHISGMPLSAPAADAMAEALGRNRTVRSLTIGDAAWGDRGAGRFLAGLRTAGLKAADADPKASPGPLTALDLELKGLGPAVIPPLLELLACPHFARLAVVRLGRNAIGDAGVQTLCDGLVAAAAAAHNGELALRVLDLAANEMTSAGAAAIGAALPILPLTELNLADNPLGPTGAAAIAAGLLRSAHLETLTLASTGVGADGAVALAGAVSQHAALKSLDLRLCGITGDVGDAFEVCLATNQSLVKLDLGQNALGDAAVVGLAQGLAQHPSLAVLNLRSNNIGAVGFRALFDAGSASMTTLTLFDNPIGNDGLVGLSSAFPALEQLDLGAAGLDDAGAKLLFRWLEDGASSPQLVALETAANTLASVAVWDDLANHLARLRPRLDWTYRKPNDDDGPPLPATRVL